MSSVASSKEDTMSSEKADEKQPEAENKAEESDEDEEEEEEEEEEKGTCSFYWLICVLKMLSLLNAIVCVLS